MPNEIIKQPDPAEGVKAMILQATINNIKKLGRETTMKKAITLIVLALLLVMPALAQDTKLFTDRSQPIAYMPSGYYATYSLAPAKACTTKTYLIAALGGFSFAFWDSVLTGTVNVDTVIIKIKPQIAWYDTSAAFSCTGWATADSIVCTDTLIASTTAASKIKWSRGYGFTYSIPRAPYMRYIITNAGPDTLRALKFFPCHTTVTQ